MNSGGLFVDAPQQQGLADFDISGNADQAPQGDGRITYHIQGANGQTASVGDQEILRQLASAGLKPTGLSPDARLISFNSKEGQYQVPVDQALQKLGWQVTGKDYNDSNRDYVNPALSYAINTPSLAGDDAAKHEFLTHYLTHHGIESPQVEGSGDDWHVLDPASGKYVALTKGEGAGLDDVAKYGAKAPSFLGSVLGAGLGAEGGPMGMAGMSAAGGFAGARAADLGGSAIDQEAYAAAMRKNGFQHTAANWGRDAAFDALGGLGGAGIAKAFPAMAKSGVASAAAQGAGSAMEAGGEGLSYLAGKAAQGFPRELGMAAMDPTGAAMLGDTLQIPAGAIKGAASIYDVAAPPVGKMIQRVASHPAVEEALPNLSASARRLGQNMRLRTPTNYDGQSAEEILHHTPFGGVGKLADQAENLGKGIVAPVRAAYTGATRGAQGLGKVMQGAGATVDAVGRAVAPHEMNALNHMGSEELRQRLLKRQRDLQMQGVDRRLVPDNIQLADQPY